MSDETFGALMLVSMLVFCALVFVGLALIIDAIVRKRKKGKNKIN
jgi:hypothetical protein